MSIEKVYKEQKAKARRAALIRDAVIYGVPVALIVITILTGGK